jgi:hypothetical protein
MKNRPSILLAAAFCAIALITACSKPATTGNGSNTGATNTANTRTSNTTTTTTNTSSSSSPSDVLKASFNAAKNQDVAAFKKSIASADMQELEAAVRKGGQDLDDLLKKQLEKPETPMPDSLETRNEKIDGDKATVEYKDVKGTWKTARFVKEGGEWKIKLDDAQAEQPTTTGNKNSDDTDEHGGGH